MNHKTSKLGGASPKLLIKQRKIKKHVRIETHMHEI
jgi:hypothetical protein